MTTSTDTAAEAVLGRSWKVPSILGLVTLLALLLFVVRKGSGTSTFALASEDDFFALPAVGVPSYGTGLVVVVLLAVITAYAAFLASQYRSTPLWLLAVFAVLFVFGFLAWAADGETIPVPGLLIGAVALSTPLIFGAMGGVISERVGVINIAIEGQLLAGAFVSAVVASITGSTYVALLAALIAGALTASLLAVFSIRYFVNQVIVGVVLNVLVVGLTSFLYSVVLTKNAETLNSPPRFGRIDIPVLSQIPILGPVLFRQTLIVYLMYIAVALVFFGLFHTKWGLRLRAVGEHPQAADTVGINVARTRFWNVCLAGAIAGLGGAYFTLGSVGAFGKEMTAGAGYIALAAVIFGRWDPVRATLAALLFGFASNLQNVLGIIGSPVPSEFMLMLPYVVTIFAVAGLVGHVRGPAAAGKPYASRS
ncbi:MULTISPECIES: ABC transporter permease [unclassified Rhodococcus (in: high G+C Gram-positive bacteria)]|uniref:ABC transporter permease n=1 Tax=unclassified Rhodococcus (in: high G+C Gram-positive bacteria) TaxID=192944 RepID=UPI000B9C71F0|nr:MULTISPECIES: ABC transporter permease [unclassified Rhodococcus (in: high G+C Gram-positive bacteria)]OZE33042.1 ABC transporter permease [Rhodococcus sp. 05-2254-4]OZE44062.1 ABC transporter permease [Rhodococcus sp. 05-2254-3]OZE56255.1 ABC transporter permease [Rhodococcus sp. 05-2254-2]